MRQNKVSDQKTQSVKTEAVHGNDRCRQDLCSTPERNAEQRQNPDRYFGAKCPEPIFFDFANEQKEQGEDPKHLQKPQYTNAGHALDQITDNTGNASDVRKGVADRHIHPAGNPMEQQQSKRYRHKEFIRAGFRKLPGCTPLQ